MRDFYEAYTIAVMTTWELQTPCAFLRIGSRSDLSDEVQTPVAFCSAGPSAKRNLWSDYLSFYEKSIGHFDYES